MSILVYTENWDGKFKKQSFELLSYGRKLADLAGTQLVALSVGQVAADELQKLSAFGADKLLNAAQVTALSDHRLIAGVLAAAAEQETASVVVLAHNNTGKALAPRLSVRLSAGLATAVIAPPVQMKPFQVQKKIFSGKALTLQEIKTDRAVLTLAPNSFEVVEKPGTPAVVDFAPAGLPEPVVKVLNTNKQSGKILLTDAEIVVSGGRGMKSGDNWGPIEELAEVLGAGTACSRPVSDEGWRPHNEHTGQTGKIIAPNLYFAFGISGAIQHLAGVSSSKCIVAVNTDPDAPIFEAADYGIVGDALKVLPDLIAAVKEVKA